MRLIHISGLPFPEGSKVHVEIPDSRSVAIFSSLVHEGLAPKLAQSTVPIINIDGVFISTRLLPAPQWRPGFWSGMGYGVGGILGFIVGAAADSRREHRNSSIVLKTQDGDIKFGNYTEDEAQRVLNSELGSLLDLISDSNCKYCAPGHGF